MCRELILVNEERVKCFYCKKEHHRDCLEKAMRMRDAYQDGGRNGCIDLHPNLPVQETGGTNDPRCLVVGGDSNFEIVRYRAENNAAMVGSQDDPISATNAHATTNSNGRWTCADGVQISRYH